MVTRMLTIKAICMKNKKMIFNIFGKKIKVKLEKNISSHGLEGLYSPKEKQILYAQHEDEKELMKTLIHEIGHAVWHITGLSQTSISHDVQEIICENISQAVVDNLSVKFKK